MRQQQANALFHPASDPTIHAFPEQAVVHKDGIGLIGNGRFNQGAAGRHAADDVANCGFAFDLQTVRAVVFEALGLQQGVEMRKKVLALDHGTDCAKPHTSTKHAGTKKGSRSYPFQVLLRERITSSPWAASPWMPSARKNQSPHPARPWPRRNEQGPSRPLAATSTPAWGSGHRTLRRPCCRQRTDR